MVITRRAADLVDMLDYVRRLLRCAVEASLFIKYAAKSAFHRGTVVTDFPENECVARLSNLLKRIQDTPHLISENFLRECYSEWLGK
jgi:hypothetical protein